MEIAHIEIPISSDLLHEVLHRRYRFDELPASDIAFSLFPFSIPPEAPQEGDFVVTLEDVILGRSPCERSSEK
jgi:hypothetical protein